MSWSTPLTAVANVALTAAQWNASVRDNLAETAPAKATTAGGLFVATGSNSIAQRLMGTQFTAATETTTNTGYVDLTTVGPAATVTSGTQVLLIWGAHMWNNTTGERPYMSYAISGATTNSAGDSTSYAHDVSGSGRIIGTTKTLLITGLTGGSNTFTAKYRVSAGTGTWAQRSMTAIPF